MEYVDLTGMLLKSQKELKSDKWEIIEFPAIMPSNKPCVLSIGRKDELEGVKASLSVGKWNAQWMQNPTAEEGSLSKESGGKFGTKVIFHHYNTSYNPTIQPF